MKRSLVIAAAVAGSIALAGCGSSAGSSGSGGTSSSSSSAAAAAVKSGDTVDLAPIMKKASDAVLAKKTGHMSMDMGSSGSLDADVDYAGSTTTMKMSMDAAGQKLDMIFVDKVLYLGGTMAAQLGGGKKWVKIDPNGTDALSKQMAPILAQMGTAAQNPTAGLAALQGAKATVSSVEGSNTTYSVTLDKDQIAHVMKASGAGALGDTSAVAPASLAYTITLDGDSLPVKVVTTAAGVGATVNFSKWGDPVVIAAPPASDVGTVKLPG
jgi:hypothetical protein